VRAGVRRDRAWLRARGADGRELDRGTLESLVYHGSRSAAAILGTRADRLPPGVRRALSKDGRGGFEPIARG
jgi:hypothetical protein